LPARSTNDAGALARCVGDVEGFLATTFATGLHLHQGSGFTDLLSLADVDAQLAGGGLRLPVVRLVQDGEPVDPATWTRRARTGGRWVEDLVDADRVVDAFGAGATVVLQSLQRWWPPVAAFCRELEAGLGHAVQANAYLTPAGARGLAPHHDTHDVFVLQLHGTKAWTVRAPLLDAPLARHRSEPDAAGRQPALLEATLRPGDSLYLPRGFVHAAAAQEGVSLHLTVGVLATTVHDIVRDLLDGTADDARFRRTLDPTSATDADAAATVVKQVVADLIAWLERVDVDAVADRVVARAAARRRPGADGRLLAVAGGDQLTDAVVVAVRDGLDVVTERDGERVRVRAADRAVALPAAIGPSVERLLDGRAHRVGELDELDEPSRVVLVRRLLREGLLRIVDG
jgi:hypothetical protein